MRINVIDFYQANDFRYTQTLWIHRGDVCHRYNAHTPARFARFMAIVLAFAARHDEERKNAEN